MKAYTEHLASTDLPRENGRLLVILDSEDIDASTQEQSRPMRTSIRLLVITSVIFGGGFDTARADVTKVPSYDGFIVVPLRIHVFKSKQFEAFNCTIMDAELTKAVAGINAIWSKAGIHFGLESIVHEEPAQIERFKALVELNQGQFSNLDVYAYLLPLSSRVFDGLNVYLFHELPLNGAYINAADAALVLETPDLRSVKGGTDQFVARVAAQGLGRALNLSTRKDEVGLLSSGTNGTGLSEIEIQCARQVARTVPGALDVEAAATKADAALKNRDLVLARRLWTWLSEIPGTGASMAKEKLKSLPATAQP